ncbi:MAG TPA: hypothetical protein VK469_08375 [Candidatus Kapabacteria bacterium]|nr:hypothetical protein [Candidatus Kapabacteria bacterium]
MMFFLDFMVFIISQGDISGYTLEVFGPTFFQNGAVFILPSVPFSFLDRLGLAEGYLVIFDPGKKKWEQKIYYKDEIHHNKKIIMVGM